MKAILVLACEGRTDDGFQFCAGVENLLIDLEKITHTENYKALIQYLDRVPKIFDATCCNNNVITNTVYKIYELGYITEKRYKQIANFYKFHSYCGMVLQAKIKT